MKRNKYTTSYEIVHRMESGRIITNEEFTPELGSGFMAAAVKVIHNDFNVTSRDAVVDKQAWVDCDKPNYRELAIESRKSLN